MKHLLVFNQLTELVPHLPPKIELKLDLSQQIKRVGSVGVPIIETDANKSLVGKQTKKHILEAMEKETGKSSPSLSLSGKKFIKII